MPSILPLSHISSPLFSIYFEQSLPELSQAGFETVTILPQVPEQLGLLVLNHQAWLSIPFNSQMQSTLFPHPHSYKLQSLPIVCAHTGIYLLSHWYCRSGVGERERERDREGERDRMNPYAKVRWHKFMFILRVHGLKLWALCPFNAICRTVSLWSLFPLFPGLSLGCFLCWPLCPTCLHMTTGLARHCQL